MILLADTTRYLAVGDYVTRRDAERAERIYVFLDGAEYEADYIPIAATRLRQRAPLPRCFEASPGSPPAVLPDRAVPVHSFPSDVFSPEQIQTVTVGLGDVKKRQIYEGIISPYMEELFFPRDGIFLPRCEWPPCPRREHAPPPG